MHQPFLVPPAPPWLADALDALTRHRFLTAPQLAALVAVAPDEAERALHALVQAKLLRLLRPPVLGPNLPPPAYALTRRGATLFARVSGATSITVPHPTKSLVTLAHEVLVSELAVVLELLAKRGLLPLRRFDVRRERIGFSTVLSTRRGPDRVALVADAYAVVEHEGRLHGLLLECDRGTVSIARMRRKFAGYLAWWGSGGPEAHFGLRALRILVVAPTTVRLERLRLAALEAAGTTGSGLFWFCLERELAVTAPERFLAPVWSVSRPADGGGHTLLSTTRMESGEPALAAA